MSIPPPPRPVRWLLAAGYPFIGAVVTALALVVVPLGVLLWPIDRRLRVARVMMLLLIAMWEDIGIVVGCWWLWLRALVRGREHWVEDHEALILAALDHAMTAAGRLIGFHVELDHELDWGDEGEPLVVLSRHAGPADSLALAWLLTGRARRVPRIVLADALLWDPGTALVLERLSSYFVPSASGAGDDRSRGVAELAASLGPRDAMLIFPEGRNWTIHRQQDLVTRLRAKGETERAAEAERWRHVLPPRPKGVVTILTTQPRCDVMVVAHTGLEVFSSPREVWRAIPFRSRLLVSARTYQRQDIPHDPAGIEHWLDERWDGVNAWVDSHRAGDY
ncbi:hypothetical protein GCM10027055_01950 [Janibacter alkaliphilus]|uniref:1-acyl-sn-glycerol-3-phosphate acyltransferase n=1 Tax=Janibacter alkaliphilus TaxID=1069963 RepID=A0A852X1Q6_9MICO|nr:1-acyl-sn-glycerol-3-phosphate acyltransferase [Janibacter alkaliphilus]